MTVGDTIGDEGQHGTTAHPFARLSQRLLHDLRHSADLAHFVPDMARRWSDVLVAETRFQLCAMMNAIEVAIGLEIDHPPSDRAVNELGPGYCRQAVENALDLFPPELLAHIRLRAALARLARLDPVASPDMGSPADLDGEEEGGGYVQALTALTLAEQRWRAPMRLDSAMRPDLPAEHFCDLAWSVAALLIHGCEAAAGRGDPALHSAIARATGTVIAHHDEGTGAFALAQRLARSLSSEQRLNLAPVALTDRRLLFFAALAQAETGVALETALSAMIEGPNLARCALMRLMAIEDAIVFQAGELLAPVDAELTDDEALAQLVEHYRTVDMADARAWLTRMSGPHALAAKLAMLDCPQ